MNPLQVLKDRLQVVLNDGSRNADFREALCDGLYACSLSEAALDCLLFSWSVGQIPTEELSDEDKQYQQGVAFVENEWHKITGLF